MQFAGQRTTLDLQPMGEPVNVLVKLTDEVLPNPEAILITGITPQATVREGITEAELVRRLNAEVFTPGTIATGFNNVRFDDVFIRYLNYRNFYDPYEWAWAEGRSRWDLLDVMRMARALRPDGVTWPVDEEGRPVNKLAMLSAANGLVHTRAHDALSDVEALIGVANHLRKVQPKFFTYLLGLRSKHEVTKIVNLEQPQPFVYTSGRYPKENHHTTVAYPVAAGKNNSLIVYDLRYDPAAYAEMPFEQLAASRWPTVELRAEPDFKPFPAKLLTPGNCPAVAPLATLTPEAEARIGLTKAQAEAHLKTLQSTDVIARLREAMQSGDFEPDIDVDGRLYDGFFGPGDKAETAKIRTTPIPELAKLKPRFADDRLPELFIRYKARNAPDSLSEDEQTAWETYRAARIQADGPAFVAALQNAARLAAEDPQSQSLLTDLKLWAESIMPV